MTTNHIQNFQPQHSKKNEKLSNKISTMLQDYADEWHVKLDEATKTITCSWSGYKPAIIIS